MRKYISEEIRNLISTHKFPNIFKIKVNSITRVYKIIDQITTEVYNAQYVTEGEVVNTFKAMVEEMFHGAATAKGALIITPEKVIITTPGADNKKEI